MKIFQNKLFIFFLILAITFVALPKITQAGDVISFVAAWVIDTIALTIGAILPLAPLVFLYCGLGGPIGNCDDWSGGSTGFTTTDVDIGDYGCLYGIPITVPAGYTLSYGSSNQYFNFNDFGDWKVYRNNEYIDSFRGTEYVDKTAPPDSVLNYEIKITNLYNTCCNPGRTDCNGWCNRGPGDYSLSSSVTTPSCTSPQDEEPMATVKISKKGCDYIEFSITLTPGSEATNYDVYRDGELIASQIPISQTIYKDAGLTKGVSYSYTIDVRSGTNLIQSYGPISASTSCLADCDFSANPENLIYPNTDSTLSWSCQGAASCSISEGIGNVDPVSGTAPVTVDKTTVFVLACSNADGDPNFSTTTVNVSRPTIIEVPPR